MGVVLWPAATCLVTELAEELGALPPDALRRTLVALPTKRLPVWLIAMLARARPAFVPPKTVNLDELIARLAPDDPAAPPLEGITDLEQELLLADLIKTAPYRHLRLGHEHEARQLLSELTAFDVDREAFPRLERVLKDDVYRSDEARGSLLDRVQELEDLAHRFDAALEALKVTTPKRLARTRSRRLAAHLESGAPLPAGLERVVLAGFTSIERMHAPLLKAAAARDDFAIWVTEPPPRGDAVCPVKLLLEATDANSFDRRMPQAHSRQPVEDVASEIVLNAPAASSGRVFAVHQTPSVLGEVAHAMKLARDAIAQGLAPSSIALLVTDDATYGGALRTLLPGAGFDANVALASPLATTPHGTWLKALFDLLASDEETDVVLALASHPLTLRGTAVSAATLAAELLQSEITAGLAALTRHPRVSAPVRAVLDRLAAWTAAFAGAPDETRALSAWADALSPLVRAVFRGERDGHEAGELGINQSAADAVSDFFAALRSGGERRRLALTAREFLTWVGPRLLALEVRSVGDPLRGVQILSVEEARYVPFDLAIVLGAAEGQFPRAVPKDYLLDNYLKTKIGLPGWQLLEAIEDTTFHLLKARLPGLVLLYPTTRGDEPIVRSRFIEVGVALGETSVTAVDPQAELLALLDAATAAPASPQWLPHVATRAGAQGRYDGTAEERAALVAPMSASALEGLIRCPYRFLLGRLNVAPLTFADEDDPRREGDWLHDVLEAFFTGRAGGKDVGAPLDTEVAWGAFRAYALARLDGLTRSLAPRHAEGTEVMLHLKLRAWPAFVDHVMTVYNEATLPRAAFGRREQRIAPESARVKVGTVDVPLRGLIDAIEDLPQGPLVTDYKRHYAPAKKDVLAGLAPQLPLYAAALAAQGEGHEMRRTVVGYWSILGGTFEAVAAGADADPDGGPAPGTLESAWEATRALWAWRQATLLDPAGVFAPDTSRCDRCELTGVCRKHDPELTGALTVADALARKLAQEAPDT